MAFPLFNRKRRRYRKRSAIFCRGATPVPILICVAICVPHVRAKHVQALQRTTSTHAQRVRDAKRWWALVLGTRPRGGHRVAVGRQMALLALKCESSPVTGPSHLEDTTNTRQEYRYFPHRSSPPGWLAAGREGSHVQPPSPWRGKGPFWVMVMMASDLRNAC